jgi:hypothetical protein
MIQLLSKGDKKVWMITILLFLSPLFLPAQPPQRTIPPEEQALAAKIKLLQHKRDSIQKIYNRLLDTLNNYQEK